MIVVTLRGGMGNQMFQYAAGLDLARRNNTSLVLDTTILNDRLPRKELTFRTYDLDVFTLEARFTGLSKISGRVPIPGIWTAIDLFSMRVRTALGLRALIKEKNGDVFDAAAIGQKDGVTLFGFWQNERYFKGSEAAVREAFRFRIPLEGDAKVLAEKIDSTNSVSLHVRRGDYVKFKSMAAMMGDTDRSYYDRALRMVGERVKDPHIFIFSDDIAWCEKNIKLSFPATYASSTSAGPKDAFHLELMSRCKHNIIANSTFSWWGAWLNRNPEKIVIAPKEWYAGVLLKDGGIIPAAWEKA